MPSTTNNLGIFFPNRVTEDVTISGGSWLASAPVTNVATEQSTETARSSDDATSSTKILIDLGQSRALRAFAMKNTNISSVGQWRVLLGSSSGGSQVLSTAWTDCWHLDYLTSLSAVGVESNSGALPSHDIIMVLGAFYTARYITIEIDDTTNTDGYVEIGKVFAGGGLIPTWSASWGLKNLRPSQSTVSRSESGAQWRYKRRSLRSEQFTLNWLSTAEEILVDELQRQLDITDECLYVPDVGNEEYTQRKGFIGLLRELSPIEYPVVNTRSIALTVDEMG